MSYFGVININSNECIGTSLSTINHNDSLLDLTIYQLSAVVNNLNTSIDAGLSEPAVGLGQRGYSAYNGAYYTTNKIYVWGNSIAADNNYDSNAPTPENFINNYLVDNPTLTITQFYSGILNSFVLLSDGTLWGVGYYEQWQNVYIGETPNYSTAPNYISNYSGTYLPLNIASLSSKKIASFDVSEINDRYVTIGVIVSGTGEAYAWGYNRYGQIGTTASGAATSYSKNVPVKITIGSKTFEQISIGGGDAGSGGNIMVKTTDGLLYACGKNNNGQLAINSLDDKTSFVQCSSTGGVPITNVQKIMNSGMQAGYTRYVTVGAQKYLYGVGDNSAGQLADTTVTDSRLFKQIGSLSGVEKIVTAGWQSNTGVAALQNDGRVFAWGYNAYGTVGNGVATTPIKTPTQVTTYQQTPLATASMPSISAIFGCNNTGQGSIGLISNSGDLFLAGVNVFTPITMLQYKSSNKHTNKFRRYEKAPLNDVTEAAFYCHGSDGSGSAGDVRGVIARDSNGAVWVWGYNTSYIVHPSSAASSYKNPRTINKY